jgi:hypothetical protein
MVFEDELLKDTDIQKLKNVHAQITELKSIIEERNLSTIRFYPLVATHT